MSGEMSLIFVSISRPQAGKCNDGGHNMNTAVARNGHLLAVRLPGSPWSLSDSANFLGVSSRHLARLIESNAIKSFKIGRRVFIADAELRRVAEHGTDAR